MKKHEYAQRMGLCEEALDNWAEVDGTPEYNCDWCDQPTWNGTGHYAEELGYNHPQAEDRICGDCWEKRQA
jgi:hypothetical protein